jgi:hypothetical protein
MNDTPAILTARFTVTVWTAVLVVALALALGLFAGWRLGKGEPVLGPAPRPPAERTR